MLTLRIRLGLEKGVVYSYPASSPKFNYGPTQLVQYVLKERQVVGKRATYFSVGDMAVYKSASHIRSSLNSTN